jgi:hypothetical protein
MAEQPDYETRASQADSFAAAAGCAETAQEWRYAAAEYRLLADFAATEVSDQEQEERLIGFSA